MYSWKKDDEDEKKRREEAIAIINMYNNRTTENTSFQQNYNNRIEEANHIINSINPRINNEEDNYNVSKLDSNTDTFRDNTTTVTNTNNTFNIVPTGSTLVNKAYEMYNKIQSNPTVQNEEDTTNFSKKDIFNVVANNKKPEKLINTEDYYDDLTAQQSASEKKEDTNPLNEIGKAISDTGKWIVDTAISTLASFVSKGYGIGKSIKEGHTERKQMLDSMSDEEIKNYSEFIQNTPLRLLSSTPGTPTEIYEDDDINTIKNKLYIQDTLQDFSRDSVNGITNMLNNVLNFISFGNIKKDFIPELPDISVLENSEKYGNYSSQEELTQSIQNDVENTYKELGFYNPSANKAGDIISDIAMAILLDKAGMGTTASVTTSNAVSTMGETGSIKETTQSVIDGYIFSKIVDSTTLNKIIKNPTSKTTQKIVKNITASNPELINTEFKRVIADTLPEITSTFANVASSRIISNEARAISKEGIDAFNGETQKDILIDSMFWATLSAASSGYSGVKFRLNSKQMSEMETKNQLNEWYDTLELDPNAQYSAEEIKKQYRNLAKKYHSDVGGDDSKMIDINLAYEGLNKYLKDNTIYKVELDAKPTNETYYNKNNNSGLVVKDNSLYVDTNFLLNSVAKNIVNSQIDSTITTIKDPNNRVIGLENTQAVPFEVENSYFKNIQPAITINDNNGFDVVDLNTGTKLLVNQSSIDSAIQQTREALQNPSPTLIKNIENEININKIESQEAILTIADNLMNSLNNINSQKNVNKNRIAENNKLYSPQEAEQILNQFDIDTKLNNRSYLGQELNDTIMRELFNKENLNNSKNNTANSTENKNVDTLNNKTANYTAETVKNITDEFKTQTEYTKNEMANIWNNEIDKNNSNVIYDKDGNIQSYIAIEEDGNNLKVSQYNNNNNKVLSETIVPQNGKFTSKSINNAIEKVTGVYEQNSENKTPSKSKFYNEQPNYAVSNINEIETELNKKKSYTLEQIGETWSDIQENTYNLTLDDDMYIELEENNGKLEAVLYDGSIEDDIDIIPEINRVEIPQNKNGRYTAEAINNAIKQAATIQDENRPIKGQVDIEGNIVKENSRDIDNIKEQLHNRIHNAIISKNSKGKTYLGDISNKVKNRIKKLLNIDVTGRRHVLSDNDIRHMIKEHGDEKKEKAKGQIPITLHDIEKIPDILNSFDKIIVGNDNKEGRTIRYIKNYTDNVSYVVEVVPEKGKALKIKTMWKKPVRVTNSKNAPSSTPKTKSNLDSTTSTNNSIPQKNKNVKNEKNTIISNSTQNDKNNTTRNMKKQNGGLTKIQYDTKGQEISYKQAQYFRESKVRDDNGNLKVVYHGTNNAGFTEFKRNINYYTDNIDIANTYTGNNGIYEGYLNIKNPIVIDANKEVWSKIDINNIKINGIENIKEFLDLYGASTWKENGKIRTSTADIVSAISDAIEDGKIKADGIIINNIYDEGAYSNSTGKYLGNDYITFNSNQFKNTTNEAPTSNSDIRYMKKNNTKASAQKATDNQGRTLSKQQQEYFKNSIIRDDNGNLKTLYHGTDAEFTVFNYKYLGKNGTSLGKGFYLTDDINTAKSYAERGNGKVMEVYANIQKPLSYGKTTISSDDYIKFIEAINDATKGQLFGDYRDGEAILRGSKDYNEMIEQFQEDYKYGGDDIDLVTEILNSANLTLKDGYRILKETLGYDGIISNKGFLTDEGTVYIPLLSEQIKNVDNINPTSNEDIRFAKRNSKETDSTKLNAEREEAYIEQEIQKIEKTGKWDDSIPVTKLTDIRKTIEDYLGLGIKKGHFRQDAYGIYKTNRDVIRTKEYKDIDTILHETGHAMDLGNRLKVDKESIADELLAAIDRLGGYENESRTIKLEEGFAEVIRKYAIIPEQAKQDFPQTIAVLEGLKQTDKRFNDFITKVQQQSYNYIHQNPRNRTLSNISIGEQTDKKNITKNFIKQEVMRNIYDKDWAVKSAVNELAKTNGKTVNQIKASDNAYYLTRLTSGISDKVVSILSDGYIDENGNKLFPGLNKIGEILGDDAERYNDLRANLVANRDIDYKAKTLKTGLRNMDTKTVREQFKQDSEIQQSSKLVYDTLNGVMQYAVDNGLISQDTMNKLKESNAFYVPMQRVIENRGNQVGRKGAVADIIKQRTGSELDVKDVLENIIANSSNVIRQVENNNILKAFYKEGEATGLTGTVFDVIDTPMTKIGTQTLEIWEKELQKQGVNTKDLDLEKTIDIFAPNKKIDTINLITSFIDDNGKRIYLQFNDEVLFNSLMNMDKKFMSQVLKINSKMNMPLRYGATMANLGFAIPNMISDTVQASVYSTAGFIPVVDNALGVLDILASTNKTVRNFVNSVAPEYAERINKLYSLYQQSGATNSTRLSQYRESAQNLMSDVYGTKSKNLGIKEKYKPLKRLLDILTYIPEISEQSTRFEVFKKNYEYYKKKGTSEMDSRILAALESRDATQDFGRTGNITREINQLIPFSAARVGSAYTFAEKVKANPKQVGIRIAILTAIAMAIKAMGYDDKEIEELNQRKKDDNFVMKAGDDVVTIKKPQGILRSIINLAEYIQDLATGHIEDGKEGERLSQWLNNAIMDNMPADEVTGLVPNAVAPLIENAINKDFYYNTDIVKSYDQDLPDSEQYYDYNSQLAIWLGQIFNYSPAKIDNLISGYFGGLGTSVTDTIDYALGKMGITAQEPEMGAEDNAIAKRFVVNVNSNSSSIDEIYNKKTELTKLQNGGTITSEQEKELEIIKSAISNISDLNKQIKEIKKDLTKSGSQKAEEIKILQQEKTDTARQALGKEVIHPENASKIQSTQFYPNNTLTKSGYSLTLTTEQKKEYEQYAYEFYSKYENQGLYSEDKLKEIKSKAKDYAKGKMFQQYKSNLVKTK